MSISRFSSFHLGNKSSWNTSTTNNIEQKPFSQQFDYHLADVPIRRRKAPFVQIGVVVVFFPGISEFEVAFRNREPVEELREAIEEKIGVSIKNYYVVCKKGIIDDGRTLDDFGIENGSNIVLVEKGISSSDRISINKQWIKNRKFRRENPTAKLTFPIQPRQKPKPKKVKRKIQEKTSLDAIDSYLKSVKIEKLL